MTMQFPLLLVGEALKLTILCFLFVIINIVIFLSALLPDLTQLPFYNATLFAEKLSH